MLESVEDMAEAPTPADARAVADDKDDIEPRGAAADAFLERAASALFAARTVLVYGEISTDLARTVSAQLLALAASGDRPVRMIVHSQGGHVEAADAIHDLVRAIGPDVIMIGSGWAPGASDIEIEATQIMKMRERLNRIFARATGQAYERVALSDLPAT